MAQTNETGAPTINYNMDYPGGSLSTNTVINGSAHKLAMIGQVWHPTVKTGTINIRKVYFRCGALTANFAGGTEVRVSFQDVSPSAGPPYQPDTTQDQFYDFKTATTTLTQNAQNVTGAMSSDRAIDLAAVNLGDTNSRWLAVVFEFNAFNASDSIIINGYTYSGGTRGGLGGIFVLNTAGTYATVATRVSNIVLECDDGTFAFLMPAHVFSALGTASVSSSGAIRRAGLKFKVPTTRKIDRAALALAIANGSDGRLVLYDSDGTTELASVVIDNDAAQFASVLYAEAAFQQVTLTANTFYRLAFVGGTATASAVSYFDVGAAGHLDGMLIGQNAMWTQHDGTNWADTATRQPFFGLGFSAFDNGASGGVVSPIGS